MPNVKLTETELTIELGFWEKIFSCHSSITLALKNIRGATDDDKYRGFKLGVRAPGTGIPGLIYAGTYRDLTDVQFVYWTRGSHCVVIELQNERWTRVILGVNDARKMAIDINAAIDKLR